MGDDRGLVPTVAPRTHEGPSRRDLLRLGLSALLPVSAPIRAAELPRPELAPFDNLMNGFRRLAGVPGAALAVARGGRLVYARGFGRLDRDRDEPVDADSLFRIASLSKPITSAAVFRLIEGGKLRLDDRIFPVLGLEGEVPKGKTLDPRWREVTILQLLRHQGGWDRSKSIDPMIRMGRLAWEAGEGDPSKGAWAIIRAMLGRPLDFVPGTRYAYSNFGYALLGRAIEKVSGRPYDAFVRDEVLTPLGATGIRLGKTLAEGRAPGEARYHDDRTARAAVGPEPGRRVPRPYGAWCLEAMDSHGGWIASAPDLVRFASGFDEEAPRPLLSAESRRALLARPGGKAGYDGDGGPLAVFYGCGWLVRPNRRTGRATRWHTGALDGTSSILVRRGDGIAFAALFNARSDALGKDLAVAIDPLVHKAIARVRSWPDGEPLAASS